MPRPTGRATISAGRRAGSGTPTGAGKTRKHGADLRHQDHEREDRLRRKDDEKWERRRRSEQRQREDDDAQQLVIVEFRQAGPMTQAQRAVTTGDGITHRIIVTTSAAYPIKQVDAF